MQFEDISKLWSVDRKDLSELQTVYLRKECCGHLSLVDREMFYIRADELREIREKRKEIPSALYYVSSLARMAICMRGRPIQEITKPETLRALMSMMDIDLPQ